MIHALEQNQLFDTSQFGFRQNKTTLDAVVKFDDYIKMALSNKSHVDVVSFDIKRAFDSIWPESVLLMLEKAGIGGYMYGYIKDLSSTIFIIAFQHLLNVLRTVDTVQYSAYADDLLKTLYKRWLIDSRSSLVGLDVGLEFSKTKSKFLHICDPGRVFLYGSEMERNNEIKYFLLTIQKNYRFDSDVKCIREKLIKDLNVLKMLSSKNSMVAQDTLRKIIIALAVPKGKNSILH